MKYKMLTAVALMIAAWTPDAKAQTGGNLCDKVNPIHVNYCSEYSRLNPLYWQCNLLFTTLYGICQAYNVGILESDREKFAKIQQACKTDTPACKKMLDDDVERAAGALEKKAEGINVGQIIKDAEKQVESEINTGAKSAPKKEATKK